MGKKKYEAPLFEITLFSCESVLLASFFGVTDFKKEWLDMGGNF